MSNEPTQGEVAVELTDLEFERLVAMEEFLSTISNQVRVMLERSGLSRRELAQKMGLKSPSTIQRLVRGGGYNATLETISRVAWACGYDIDVRFRPAEVEPGFKASVLRPGEFSEQLTCYWPRPSNNNERYKNMPSFELAS